MNDAGGYPAAFWHGAENNTVQCTLCPHNCVIPNGKAGLCRVRKNRNGKLSAESYGRISSLQLDPVKKKPLYRFHPEGRILSVGSVGCNLRCPFCQNHTIAPDYTHIPPTTATPREIAAPARAHVPNGNIGVAYTYNEPLVGYEFVRDCAEAIHRIGLKNVLVTNGYINPAPLKALLPYIDAMNIDLKAFHDGFYKKLGGTLAPVKETIALAHKHCHIEVTTLIIPGENENDIAPLAEWLAGLDTNIALHISRFFPRHEYARRAPTPPETVLRLCEAARKHLKYVYAGNV